MEVKMQVRSPEMLTGEGQAPTSQRETPAARERGRRPKLIAAAASVALAIVLLFAGFPVSQRASAVTIPMVFPLEIRVPVLNDYLAPRTGHLHQGTDLLAPKMTKELAVVSGTVTLRTSTYNGQPSYSLWLKGDDGHGYFYIHINNDTPGTDDGRGGLANAFAPGLASGGHVEQGQFIAYVGDSGNAENTVPHLHFEIHQTTSMSSASINPHDSVANAPMAGGGSTTPSPDPKAVRYEQDNAKIAYTGKWSTYTTSKASSGDYAYAGSATKASIKFAGTRLDLIATRGINQGKARVTLDGGSPVVVDLYSPIVHHQQAVWSSGALPDGTHIVSLEWTGSTSAPSGSTVVNIDAVDVTGTLSASRTVTTIEQNNNLLAYTGAWNGSVTSMASGGSFRYANVAGASVTAKFTGTYLGWIAKKSPAYGKAKVTLDGGTPVTVDLHSASTLWKQRVWQTGTLTSGTHTVKIEWTGTKNSAATAANIGVDAFEIQGSLTRATTDTPAPPTAPSSGDLVVVIDPGHQAKANTALEPVGPGSSQMKARVVGGTIGVVTGAQESQLVLTVGLKLRDALTAQGVKVVMTRTTQDVDLSNVQRAQIANQAGADLFVRLHADGSGNAGVSGVYVLYPASIAGWTDDIAAASTKAAQMVKQGLVAATGAKDQGSVPRSDMAGFNWSDVPVFIAEIGFMTNPAEDKLLATAAYQDKVVKGLSQAVLSYLKAQ
jgi:N-acetylmuramoyl-L-alanine amidase